MSREAKNKTIRFRRRTFSRFFLRSPYRLIRINLNPVAKTYACFRNLDTPIGLRVIGSALATALVHARISIAKNPDGTPMFLFVTRNMAPARRCDRIIELVDGRIVSGA